MAETKVAMWRSVRKEDFASVLTPEGMPVKGVLYPDFERRLITGGKRKGQYRPPDVTTFVDEVEGVNVRNRHTHTFLKRAQLKCFGISS